MNPVLAGNAADIDLLWLDKSSNETGFELERSRVGVTGFVKIATLPTNTTFYTDKVTTNGQFCYRIRAVNATGASAYSNESCQTVSVITTMATAARQGLEVAPNPSAGRFEVKLTNDLRGPLTLRVTDAVGRQVLARPLSKTTPTLQTTLDLSDLRTGIYHLHLDLPNGTSVVRLLKQ